MSRWAQWVGPAAPRNRKDRIWVKTYSINKFQIGDTVRNIGGHIPYTYQVTNVLTYHYILSMTYKDPAGMTVLNLGWHNIEKVDQNMELVPDENLL